MFYVFSTGQNFKIAVDMKYYNGTKACSGTEELIIKGLLCSQQDLKMYAMFKGSQSSVDRTGQIWSYFLLVVRNLSAVVLDQLEFCLLEYPVHALQ